MRFLGFLLVGSVGFIVDGGVLTALSQLAHINIYLARGVSFSLATLVTWLLNRTFVFNPEAQPGSQCGTEYAKYIAVQIAGALANLGVFAALIASRPSLESVPIIPLGIGASFGLVVNFLGARYWVFQPSERRSL